MLFYTFEGSKMSNMISKFVKIVIPFIFDEQTCLEAAANFRRSKQMRMI